MIGGDVRCRIFRAVTDTTGHQPIMNGTIIGVQTVLLVLDIHCSLARMLSFLRYHRAEIRLTCVIILQTHSLKVREVRVDLSI